MKPTHVQLIIANKSGQFCSRRCLLSSSWKGQAGLKLEPEWDQGKPVMGVTAALPQPPSWGSRLQGRGKGSFKSNCFSMGGCGD